MLSQSNGYGVMAEQALVRLVDVMERDFARKVARWA
jgi:hypothetical protein